MHSLTSWISRYICTTAWKRLLERRLTRWRMREDIPRCWQHLARAAERTHCLDSSLKLKRFESQCLGAYSSFLSLFPSLSVCLHLTLLPSSLLKQKAFLTVLQSSQGSGEKHWLNTAHSVCKADHGCSQEKGLFREGGGREGKLLPWSHS